jgi:hypothetical protein
MSRSTSPATPARPVTPSGSIEQPAAPSRTTDAPTTTAPTTTAPTAAQRTAQNPVDPAPEVSAAPQTALGGCSIDPDVATTAQGRAYLLAVQAAQPTWNLVTSSLNSERGEDGDVQQNDLAEQAGADRGFLAGLKAISFTGTAAQPAGYLTSALTTYVSLLDQAAAHPGYFSAQQRIFAQVDEARAEASDQLGTALGLPSSNCTVLRP